MWSLKLKVIFLPKKLYCIPLLCIFFLFYSFFITPLHLYVFWYSLPLSHLVFWSFLCFMTYVPSFISQLFLIHWFLGIWSCSLCFFLRSFCQISAPASPLTNSLTKTVQKQTFIGCLNRLSFEQKILVPFICWLLIFLTKKTDQPLNVLLSIYINVRELCVTVSVSLTESASKLILLTDFLLRGLNYTEILGILSRREDKIPERVTVQDWFILRPCFCMWCK